MTSGDTYTPFPCALCGTEEAAPIIGGHCPRCAPIVAQARAERAAADRRAARAALYVIAGIAAAAAAGILLTHVLRALAR